MPDLSVQYGGLSLPNPLIVGSSGLTSSVANIAKLAEAGAGAVVLKSIYEEEIIGTFNKQNRQMLSKGVIYPELLDCFHHLMNDGGFTDDYLQLINDSMHEVDIPVIASVNSVSNNAWPYFVKDIERAGADAIELNLFLLPSDLAQTPDKIEQMYFDIVSEILGTVDIPLFLKISDHFTNLSDLVQRLSGTGLSGIVLFNRYHHPDIDIDSLQVNSGPIYTEKIRYLRSLRWILGLHQRVKCDLAASGGVHDTETLIKMLLAGASAVECVSGIYKSGTNIIGDMLSELEQWMQQKGYDAVKDFNGLLSVPLDVNPAAVERENFIRNYK